MVSDWTLIIALGGWFFAILQFAFSHTENIRKNEADLLEKTLGYFVKGMLARSIAIGLVDGIWLQKKKFIDVILPVLISQANFLLTEAEDSDQEQRNLIRLLDLIYRCLPYARDRGTELAEISEALISGARSEKGVNLAKGTLRLWFEKLNNGGAEIFEAETEDI
ncbi:MAG: hypothetical protein E6Q60_02390 [Nitrosomonas oligotropha]|uniref:Uncharacterized protein n=1 Tax=Nitrosomonas oligotropha TaxID=42354 RepID=A0A5C7W027_9PROT|nr:MAG: hypothetical protein E6Q60_02390 [Nitrosomonas oligotropha]